MTIGFAGEQALLEQVAAGVSDPHFSICWNLVFPACFSEAEFAERLRASTASRASSPLVALITIDHFESAGQLVEELHSAWREELEHPVSLEGIAPALQLTRLIGALPRARPAVLLLRKFEAALEVMTEPFLGALRDAEQFRRIRTVTFSTFPYHELRRRWQLRATPPALVTSDYGTTPAHQPHVVSPLPAGEIAASLAKHPSGVAIPRRTLDWMVEMTGGYPVPLEAMFGAWVRGGCQPLTPDVRATLVRTVEAPYERFVALLDPSELSESHFRERLIDLYDGVDPDGCAEHLRAHPWCDVLLGEVDHDGSGPPALRARLAGKAAIAVAVREAAQRGALAEHRQATVERAIARYARFDYSAVTRITDALPSSTSRTQAAVLAANARIMLALRGDGRDGGIDADWRAVMTALEHAQRFVGPDNHPSTRLLAARYAELRTVGDSIVKAQANGERRVVEVLAGLRGSCVNRQAALFLLELRFQTGRTIVGDTSALLHVIALPEQIFNVWAFWALGLNYYHVPSDDHAAAWAEVERAWSKNPARSQLRRPEPGQSFQSFRVFALFAHAIAEQRGVAGVEGTFDKLEAALSLYDDRSDSAHALALTPPRVRRKYYELIDRWLSRLEVDDARGKNKVLSRSELRAIAEPLPCPRGHVFSS